MAFKKNNSVFLSENFLILGHLKVLGESAAPGGNFMKSSIDKVAYKIEQGVILSERFQRLARLFGETLGGMCVHFGNFIKQQQCFLRNSNAGSTS